MKNKKIIVNYQKEWGNDGTVYSQTITIKKEIAKKFNNYIKQLKEEAHKKFILSNEDMKTLYYLEEVKEGKNYTHLTTLNYFTSFYLKHIYTPPKKDKNFERILYRNTIIKVI